ncbi:hypothetical protein FHT87_003753 [Rhizobium sp. BK316]|nr:hypothetical protein [Rhizobium sp. BK316]
MSARTLAISGLPQVWSSLATPSAVILGLVPRICHGPMQILGTSPRMTERKR